MAKLMSAQGVEPLILTQVAGPGRPRRIRVLPLEELLLGRDDDCHVVLDEDPMSRHHAKVLYLDYQPEILDLGSTNGTYLNGKKVNRAILKHGDQIQLGSSIFEALIGKEHMNAEPGAESRDEAKRVQTLLSQMKGKAGAGASQQTSAISGRLAEIHLSSLLQVIESDQATGTLVIRHGGREGKLHFHHGMIRHATLGRARGPKALYRIMALKEGQFDFYIPGRSPEYDNVEGNLQHHLLEAARQKDELEVYRRKLPPLNAVLVFHADKVIPPSKMPAAVFEVMASVSQFHSVGKIIDYCRLPDVEVCRILLLLLKHQILLVKTTKAQPTLRVKPDSN
jgi:pSer/pThr/pTyr-binding forkhead associated (FHA) protein